MSNLVGSHRKSERHSVLCVAVNSVCSDFCHQTGNRIWPRHSRIPRALVPHHHWKKDAYSATVEIRNHLSHARNASRHRTDHVVRVAVVYAHVRVRGPDEDSVDSAVSFFQIVQITTDRVAVSDRIVEIAVLHHHLRLEKAGLRPLELRSAVARPVVADADLAFITPVANICQPGVVLVLSTRCGSSLPCSFHVEAAGGGNLLTIGTKAGVLC